MNLTTILIFHLNDPPVKACLPTDTNLDNLTVVYSFINIIRSEIFNFNIFIHNPDVKVFLQDNSIEDSYSKDKDQQHIVTRDLQITQNSTLRKLFT